MRVWRCVMNSKITTLPGNPDEYSGSSINECDKSARNIYVISSKLTEQAMSESSYKKLEAEREGFKVIIEFPDNSDEEAVIHEEIKQILSNLLQEQMMKIS